MVPSPTLLDEAGWQDYLLESEMVVARANIKALLARPAFLVTGTEARWRDSSGTPCILAPMAVSSLDPVGDGMFRLGDRPIPGWFYPRWGILAGRVTCSGPKPRP